MKNFISGFLLIFILSACDNVEKQAATAEPLPEILTTTINADSLVESLPLKYLELGESDNRRVRQRWDIVFKEPNDVPQRLEVIGNNQKDADLLAINCHTFNSAGNVESAADEAHFCHQLFKSVLAKFIKNPLPVSKYLITQSEGSKKDAYLDSDDLRFEVGDGFYFVRKISRIKNSTHRAQ